MDIPRPDGFNEAYLYEGTSLVPYSFPHTMRPVIDTWQN